MKRIKYLSLIAIMLVALTGCGENKEEKQKETPKDTIVLKENLKLEINSEVNLLSLLSDNNKVEIISEDEQIDTSSLGTKELVIRYKDNEEEKEHKFTIDIVDTQAPTIEYQKELTTKVGTKIDLLKNVKVSDNSKEKIKATVEGEYDIKKEGTYNLKYVAVDSSNNKTEEEFILKVSKKATSSSNSNNTTSNNTSSNNSNKTQNNSNNNTSSGGNTEEVAQAIFDKYVGIYDKKYTKKPEKFSPEKYVTIETDDNPIEFHYEWIDNTKTWSLVIDKGYSRDIKEMKEVLPPPSRDGELISYEENGITYYKGEKTGSYKLYFYRIKYEDDYQRLIR